MLGVALLGYLVPKLAHSTYHHSEHVSVVLILVVLTEFDQFQQKEEGDWGEVIVLEAEVVVADLEDVFVGKEGEGFIFACVSGQTSEDMGQFSLDLDILLIEEELN